jgi:hypothetical protein
MDVTSLLNQSAAALNNNKQSRETTPASPALQQAVMGSTTLPTPSPERTTHQQDWESKSANNRTPWSAGGYALPFQTRTKFRYSSINSSPSDSDELDSNSSAEPSFPSRDSRHGSTDLASIDLDFSQLPQSSNSPQKNR